MILQCVFCLLGVIATLILFIGQNWDGALWALIGLGGNLIILVMLVQRIREYTLGDETNKELAIPNH